MDDECQHRLILIGDGIECEYCGYYRSADIEDYLLPEVSGSVNAVLFWRWLAGDARSLKYDKLAIETCGLGINQSMQAMAKLLVDLWRQKKHDRQVMKRRQGISKLLLIPCAIYPKKVKVKNQLI